MSVHPISRYLILSKLKQKWPLVIAEMPDDFWIVFIQFIQYRSLITDVWRPEDKKCAATKDEVVRDLKRKIKELQTALDVVDPGGERTHIKNMGP